MSADLSRPAELLAEPVEYTAEQDAVWEWHVRGLSLRKAAAAASEELGLADPIPVSTAAFWIKRRREREEAIEQVMHLFNRAQQQLMMGHALNLLRADCATAIKLDGTRLEKLGRLQLDIMDRICKLLGLDSPTRISIEDDRANTIEVNYLEAQEWEARNAAKLDEISKRK